LACHLALAYEILICQLQEHVLLQTSCLKKISEWDLT